MSIADRVWNDWRAQSAESSKPWIALLFASDAEAGVARRKLAAAVERAVFQFEQGQGELPDGVEEASAGAWSLAQVPEGVMLTVGEKCDAFELLLNQVADELEREGLSGSFDVYALPDAPRPPKLTDLVEARLRVNGERVPHGYRHAWMADGEALARVSTAGARWCLENRADRGVTLQVRTLPPLPVRTAEPETVLREGIEAAADLGVVTLRSFTCDGFRSVAVQPSTGRVSLVVGGSPVHRAWGEAVRELTDVIRASSRDLVYGFVKRGTFTHEAEAGTSLERDWPQPPPPGSPRDAFEDVAVPDVFGIQLLGPGIADRIPAGGEWRSTRLDGGRVLVEHQDLDAWLREPRLEDALKGVTSPPAELLARARADFASILFREDQSPR